MIKLEDIINLPHHEPSIKHPRMSIENRVAIFAPFAALTGFNDAINESSRITIDKKILSDDEMISINDKLNYIENNINSNPLVKITYFMEDSIKDGGSYLEYTGNVKKIDINNSKLIFTNKKNININDIYCIEIIEN